MTATRHRSVAAAAIAAASVAALAWIGVLWAGGAGVGTMLPWIVGRGLGIAGYLSLSGLTLFGLWLRHPWRTRVAKPSPETVLRVHAVLAPLTLVLIVGHIVALALDPFAGVGWAGAFVPGASAYRTVAVAIGTLSLYFGGLVGITAALAGRWRHLPWLPIHRFASLTFVAVWLHGVLAGSDTAVMMPIYAATGLLTLIAWITRRTAHRSGTSPSATDERPALLAGSR
jgi:predicted ferric reductase